MARALQRQAHPSGQARTEWMEDGQELTDSCESRAPDAVLFRLIISHFNMEYLRWMALGTQIEYTYSTNYMEYADYSIKYNNDDVHFRTDLRLHVVIVNAIVTQSGSSASLVLY